MRLGSIALVLASATACSGGNLASTMATAPESDMTGKCNPEATKGADKPLIIEWPVSERVALEARIRRGLVAVRYVGCEMDVLSRCTVAGDYGYLGTTRQKDGLTIKNEDDLYANVPVGAFKLAAKLAKAGQLEVDMTIVGRYESDKGEFGRADLSGECTGATHVITGITTGAFVLTTGASAEVGGGAEVSNIGAGAKSSANRETLNSAGDAAACESSTGEDERPPDNCGALLRIELAPVGG